MQLIPRAVYFLNGKAIGAGFSAAENTPGVQRRMMQLPTEHYDYLGPINVQGKTEEQIKDEVASYQ